jgi:hypothetical protein
MVPIAELKWRNMTGVVNEIQSPNTFLSRFLYPPSTYETLTTENIEVSTLVGERVMAPFVRKNGEAIMVGGTTSKSVVVEAPNIRIKRPFTASNLMFNRTPGSAIVLGPGQSQRAEVQKAIARDLQYMADQVSNAEEWMISQSLTGSITYSSADEEVYTITYPRLAAHSFTLSILWSVADATVLLYNDCVKPVQRLLSQADAGGATDVILGEGASDAFTKLVEMGLIKPLELRNVDAGTVTMAESFRQDGVLYLGRVHGLDWWEYSRTVKDQDGTETALIRSEYAEFVNRNAGMAARKMYYGAIPDMDAFAASPQGLGQMRRFAKSWKISDPSSMMSLIHSRPLPVPMKPNASVSVKVI